AFLVGCEHALLWACARQPCNRMPPVLMIRRCRTFDRSSIAIPISITSIWHSKNASQRCGLKRQPQSGNSRTFLRSYYFGYIQNIYCRARSVPLSLFCRNSPVAECCARCRPGQQLPVVNDRKVNCTEPKCTPVCSESDWKVATACG